jgi:hypothetical protein
VSGVRLNDHIVDVVFKMFDENGKLSSIVSFRFPPVVSHPYWTLVYGRFSCTTGLFKVDKL